MYFLVATLSFTLFGDRQASLKSVKLSVAARK